MGKMTKEIHYEKVEITRVSCKITQTQDPKVT